MYAGICLAWQDVSGVVDGEVPGLVTMYKGCMLRPRFRIMRRMLLWSCCSNAGEICDIDEVKIHCGVIGFVRLENM